jgi:predicted transcriptional regulator
MKILLHISDTQEEKLAEVARRLNVRPEELATAAVEDFLARAEADFQAAANRVLEKNQELYRRLS